MPDTETESVNAKAEGKSKKEAKPLPEPPFLIDYAPTARGKCKECLTGIEKNVLRFAIAKSFRGHWHYELRHWGCATPEQIKAMNDYESESDVKVLGMEKLKTEDQDRAKKALKKGHVDEKDAEAQKEKSEVAREKEGEQKKEKAKGKAEQKRKATNEDTHNEPKVKKKKTEDTEEAESPKKKKSKVKEQKEKEAEREHKEEKITKRVVPPASQIEDETVPDSEEEREITIKKYKSDEKSPKKDKSKKSSKKKDDSAMDIDWPLTPPRSDEDPNNKRKEAKDKKQKSPKKKVVNEEEEDEDINEVNDLIRTSSLDKLPDKKTRAIEVESEDEEALATKVKGTGKNASSAKEESKVASTSKKDSVEAPSKATKAKAEPAEKKPRAPRKSASMKKAEPSTSAPTPPTPAHNSATSVYVDITKIAPLLHSSHPYSPRPSAKLPPKLPLSVFCKRYELSSSLQQKLKRMEIDGPHVLRLIRDDALEKQGLSVGELAGLRDAEERWMADNS